MKYLQLVNASPRLAATPDDQRSRKDNLIQPNPLENRCAVLSEVDINDDSSTMDFDEKAESDNQTRFILKVRRKKKKKKHHHQS